MARGNDRDTNKRTPVRRTGSTEQPEENFEDIVPAGGPAKDDMNLDPLAGAMGQDSLQDDTIVDAAQEDTGLPARDDAAPPGGPGSTNTSRPAARQIGAAAPPGAIAGDGTSGCPDDYPIKALEGTKQYHSPGRATYDDIIPNWCFAREEDALNAGYARGE
ncbi:MAG: hypothetical protein M3173_02870 [Chloroflexota bacterium]|nr:hypothetical protein [Chloroflexota bacterium]